MPKKDLDQLRSDIGSGKLSTWREIHHRYDKLWDRYTLDKQKHAYALLCELLNTDRLSESLWHTALDKVIDIQKYICEQVYVSRKKDYDNQFRKATFRKPEEMEAAIGTIDDNSFIIQVKEETGEFLKLVESIRSRS